MAAACYKAAFHPCAHRERIELQHRAFFIILATLPDSLRFTLEMMQPPELERSFDVGVPCTGKFLA